MTRRVPSEVKRTLYTQPGWAGAGLGKAEACGLTLGLTNSRTTMPSATFQSFTVRSLLPEAMNLPSGLKCREYSIVVTFFKFFFLEALELTDQLAVGGIPQLHRPFVACRQKLLVVGA